MELGSDVPHNLPTAESTLTMTETNDYFDALDFEDTSIDESGNVMKELEDHAHSQRVLLSSDAMRHLIAMSTNEDNRMDFLDRVIFTGKGSYPSEDGWVVMNLSRMSEVCEKVKSAHTVNGKPTQPVNVIEGIDVPELANLPSGSGSLAEAILSGNVVAAFAMIENRPIIALADATADLDAAYRLKRGLVVIDSSVSEMLKEMISKLTVEQIEAVIRALTSAIDGTYTDEHSAVKTAIMKAVKIVV